MISMNNKLKKSVLSLLCMVVTTSVFAQIVNIPLVKVMGESRIDIAPDIVLLKVTVSRNLNAANFTAFDFDNKTAIQLKFIERDGVSTFENISFLKKNENSYTFIKEIFITITDIKQYYDVLERLIKNNYTDISNIEFRTSKLKELKQRARENSMEDASDKAKALAGSLDQTIGKAYSIEEIESCINDETAASFNSARNVAVRFNEYYPSAPGYISVLSKIWVQFELNK